MAEGTVKWFNADKGYAGRRPGPRNADVLAPSLCHPR